ncbi:MAG: NUDIX hydrolase [Candidatus Limnocylindria bacterium]
MPDPRKERLSEAAERELATLAERYGQPRLVSAHIDDSFFDPIRRPDRFGEVCMAIRRPNGKLILSTKDFYPSGAYRLPTGGIGHGEGILDALLRETHEETGLAVEVRRLLAWIEYEGAGVGSAEDRLSFHTFAFLLDETGGTLGSLDPDERILDFREVDPAELPAVAARLEAIAPEIGQEIVGDWAAWGRFRAVVHRAVHDVLGAEAATS